MNISLTPELEKLVQAKVASGLYNNASESDWLETQAAIGYAQLQAGESILVKSKKEFVALVRGTK